MPLKLSPDAKSYRSNARNVGLAPTVNSIRPLAGFYGKERGKGREGEARERKKWRLQKLAQGLPYHKAGSASRGGDCVAHSQVTVQNDDFLMFADYISTRGHCYKLQKGQSHVNAHIFLQIVFVRYGILYRVQ